MELICLNIITQLNGGRRGWGRTSANKNTALQLRERRWTAGEPAANHTPWCLQDPKKLGVGAVPDSRWHSRYVLGNLRVDPESWLATAMLLLEMILLEHGFTQHPVMSPHPWGPDTCGRKK